MSNLSKAQEALERIQSFDPATLEQAEKFGAEYKFTDAAVQVTKSIDFFKRLPIEALPSLPESILTQLTQHIEQIEANSNEILRFDAKQEKAAQQHQTFTKQAQAQADATFKSFLPYISYAIFNSIDFDALEEQAKAFNEGAHKQAGELLKQLKETEGEVQTTLKTVREAAAEKGVSQEAKHFKEQSKKHGDAAAIWLTATVAMVGVLVGYGFWSFSLPTPETTPAAIQFIANKFLIVFALSFFLVVCARNFQANRHNQVVNKHRQNSLQTYRTLVRAGEDPDLQNIVLFHAAASIYQLHDTGFTRHSSGDTGPSADFLPKPTLPLKMTGAADG